MTLLDQLKKYLPKDETALGYTGKNFDNVFNRGYNQALADVRKALEGVRVDEENVKDILMAIEQVYLPKDKQGDGLSGIDWIKTAEREATAIASNKDLFKIKEG